MSKTYTIAEGKNCFPAMVREAERQGVVEVTRRGRPVARLISEQEYQRVFAQRPSLWEAVERLRAAPDFTPVDDLREQIQRDRTPFDPPNPWL